MSAVAKKLNERRVQLVEEMRSVAERAGNGPLSAEDDAQYKKLNDEVDVLFERIQSLKDVEQRNADAEAALVAADGGRTPEGRAQLNKGGQDVNAELRKFATTRGSHFIEVNPEGRVAPMDVEYRDLLKSGSAGSTVPTSFYSTLWEHAIDTSAILQAGATVVNTDAGEALPVPKTTAHSTAAIVGEGVSIPESDPTFAAVTLGAFKYATRFQVSYEMANDTGVDLLGYLARQAGRALGNGFGAHFVVGTGTGQPRGVTIDSSVGVAQAGTATGFGAQATANLGADVLINLYYAVIAPYRRNGTWLMSDGAAAAARKLKTADGLYVWQPSLVAGTPDTILSRPVITDPFVPAFGTLGNKSVLFGDFSAYYGRFAGGVRFERSDEFAFDQDLITFRALQRADGALIDLTGAVKHFIHTT